MTIKPIHQPTIDTTHSTPVPSNGDFKQGAGREIVYTGINGTNGARQASTLASGAAEAVGKIPQIPGALAAIGATGAMLNPALMIPSGLAIALTAAVWTIPDAIDDLKAAKIELTEAKDEAATKEAERAVRIGQLGVANHALYGLMGGGMAASGSIALSTTSALGYAPALTGAAAASATLITGLGLGAIYLVRAPIMGLRARKNLQMSRQFCAAFKESTNKHEFMKEAAKRGDSYLARRVDATCLVERSESGNIVTTYTHSEVTVQKTYVRISKKRLNPLQIENLKAKGLEIFSDKEGTFITSEEFDVTQEKNLSRWFEGDELIKVQEQIKNDKISFMRDEMKQYKKAEKTPLTLGKAQFTESGLILKDSKTRAHTPKDQVEYLKRAEKAIFSMELKYEIACKISIAMFLGGVLTILAAVFTGGIALLVIGLLGALFFIYMEYSFLTYDNSKIFNKYRDKRYAAYLRECSATPPKKTT